MEGDYMITIIDLIEQETLVDDLQEVETKLFDLSQQLASDHELNIAWLIVYKRLQKEKEKEAKMKAEN